MTEFTLRGLQLALQISYRARLGRRRSPPSDGGDQLSPSIEEVGVDAQLLADNLSRLAAVEPVLDRFAFKGFVEFPALWDSCLFHRSGRSLFPRFSVRQFEATPNSPGWKQNGMTIFEKVFQGCAVTVATTFAGKAKATMEEVKKGADTIEERFAVYGPIFEGSEDTLNAIGAAF